VDKSSIVFGDSYTKWKYEERQEGEDKILMSIRRQPSGTFVSPAMGFWKSSFLFDYGIESSEFKGNNHRRTINIIGNENG
jgi:hypothetical protein